jgi:hypothetical protein
MSKIKLLLDVVTDLRSLAESLQAVADAIAGNEPVDVSQPETPAQVPTQKPEEKAVTLEQVRAVLAEKSHDGLQPRFADFLKSMVRQNSAKSIQTSMPPFLQKRRH